MIPGSGRSPGVGKSNPLQYSCLGNSVDRGACYGRDRGVAKSRTRLSTAQIHVSVYLPVCLPTHLLNGCQSVSPSTMTHLPIYLQFFNLSTFYPSLYLPLGEGNGTPLQYSCLENPMDRGAWRAAVHGVAKSRTRLSDFTFTFLFHALEKEMATHSGVLAWRIPGTGKPGGLPSMGSPRVGHN